VTSWCPTFLTLSSLARGTLTPKGPDGGLAAQAEGIDGISFGDTQNIGDTSGTFEPPDHQTRAPDESAADRSAW
jgi:hypothetical protein